MPRKKKAQRDARGYSQGTSVTAGARKSNNRLTTEIKKAPSSSTTEAPAVAVTTSTQQALEDLLEVLQNQDNGLPESTNSANDEEDGPSNRFEKRIGNVLDNLMDAGFSFGQIRQAVVALGYTTTTESALDWLCLHLTTQELPALFTEGQVRDDLDAITTSIESLTVVPAASGASHDNDVRVFDTVQPTTVNERKERPAQASTDVEDEEAKAAQRAWLLSQYQYEDEEEEEAENDVPQQTTKEEAGDAEEVAEQELSPDQVQLLALEQELLEREEDANDEASNYMRSKAEIKELKKAVQQLRTRVGSLKRKISKQSAKKVETPAPLSVAAPGAKSGDTMDEEVEVFPSLFDEEALEDTVENQEGLPEESNPGRPIIPPDSIPKSWTGKTPKQILEEWCRKEKTKPTFKKLPMKGCSVRVKLPAKIVEHEAQGPAPTYQDALQYACTKVLYDLSPSLPLYRLLPPFHRETWVAWMQAEERIKDDSAQAEKDGRMELIQELIRAIPARLPHRQQCTNDTPASTTVDDTPESWDDIDESDVPARPHKQRDRASQMSRSTRDFLKRQSTPTYQRMLESRKTLPVYSFRHEILSQVEKNPVIVLNAETGAGKTTQCGQFILEQALIDGKADLTSILCTQPRRVAAMSVAERVSDEMCEPSIGKLVGYQIRLNAMRSSETRLLFCTTGVVLRKLIESPTLEGISHVIVDEVHERQWQIDVLLVALRRLLSTSRPDLRVVLMSATLDAVLFTTFFNGAPLVTVPGRTFPVASYFLEDLLERTNHVIEEGSRCARRDLGKSETASLWVTTRGGEQRREVVSLDSGLDVDLSDDFAGYSLATRRSMHRVEESSINYDLIEDVLEAVLVNRGVFVPTGGEELESGAVLVFLPGLGEIRTLNDRLLGSRVFGNRTNFEVVPLHSTLSAAEQRRAFRIPQNGCRKIILSTNIAETSVTIPDVVCVVDSGRVREIQRDKRTSTQRLVATWCAKANAKQRAGRAGRVRPGVCLKLFSSHTEQFVMKKTSEPELKRMPLEEVCLSILAAGFAKSCMEFLGETPQPPSDDAIRSALRILQEIGAVAVSEDPNIPETLTPLGYHLSKLPIDVRLGKMLIFGALFQCIDSILTITATLSASQSPFAVSISDTASAKAAHAAFTHSSSDFMAMLKVWQAYMKAEEAGSSRKFCRDNFLNYSALREIKEARGHFLKQLCGIGFIEHSFKTLDDTTDTLLSSQHCSHNTKEEILHLVVCAGLYPNVGHLVAGPGGQLTIVQKQELLHIHSTSVNSKLPSRTPSAWIAFHEKFATGSRVSISSTCFVNPFSIMIFGTSLNVLHTERIVVVEEWIELGCSAKTGVMLREIRNSFDQILKAVVADVDTPTEPSTALNSTARKVVDGIVALFLQKA